MIFMRREQEAIAMRTLADIMARDVIAVDPDTPLSDVVDLLIERRITGVPVVTRGRVSGVVSATDVLDAVSAKPQYLEHGGVTPDVGPDEEESWTDAGEAADSRFFEDIWPSTTVEHLERFEELQQESDVLSSYTAGDVMTRHVHALPPDTPLDAGARYMVQAGIHRVLVVRGGKLVGIVSTSDFMRAIADGLVAAGV
jgi:CBS domain-containing protein